jgi:hypothetical protein
MKVNNSDFIVNHSSEVIKYYTKKGYESFVDDDGDPRLDKDSDKVFAKVVKDKPSKNFADKKRVGFSYYIKSTPNKTLYNPTENYSIDPKVKKSFVNKVCKSELKFLEVSESVFNMYLNFLKTENSQWLVKAQREIK